MAPAPETREPATRDAARTRRTILDVAARLFTERGPAVSIAQIASEAAVSKGGLLHHFGSREGLILALVDDATVRFREEVQALLDLSENRPGKMLRAYVRALCGGSQVAMMLFADVMLWTVLSSAPGVEEIARRDADFWDHVLHEDGLAADRVMVVRRAAEGVAAAAWSESPAGDVSAEAITQLQQARNVLLQLTEDTHPLTRTEV